LSQNSAPYALLLSAATILREPQTHYRAKGEKRKKKGSGKGSWREMRGEFAGLWLKD